MCTYGGHPYCRECWYFQGPTCEVRSLIEAEESEVEQVAETADDSKSMTILPWPKNEHEERGEDVDQTNNHEHEHERDEHNRNRETEDDPLHGNQWGRLIWQSCRIIPERYSDRELYMSMCATEGNICKMAVEEEMNKEARCGKCKTAEGKPAIMHYIMMQSHSRMGWKS